MTDKPVIIKKEEHKPVIAKKEESLIDEEKQRLLELSQISLWLDNYDDIFSDFDSRSYNQRALSDDFLYEAKKVSKEKASGKIELKLLVPERIRNVNHENIIKKRLRESFKLRVDALTKEKNEIIKKGIFFLLAGFFLMIASTYILFAYSDKNLFISFLITLFEPASWFLFWEGLSQILTESKQKKPDFDFYDKMSKCEIKFFQF